MCWSSKVSFIFVIIDLILILALTKRNVGQDRTYAIFLIPIAGQEFCQLILWLHLQSPSSDHIECTHTMKCFSTLAQIFAELVPLIMLIMAEKQNGEVKRFKFFGWFFYIIQVALILIVIIETNSWCVKVGSNHHQVWIADSALDAIGGKFLYITCGMIYFLTCIASVVSLESPTVEICWILLIGIMIFAINIFLFSQTLEFGSVWCWSAFSLGLYFWFRPLSKFNSH